MDERIDCTRCRHFLVTWRPETPRGCRLYGFEGHRIPSLVVKEATGAPCRGFEDKFVGAPRANHAPTIPTPWPPRPR